MIKFIKKLINLNLSIYVLKNDKRHFIIIKLVITLRKILTIN